jgi:DNA-binding SARP family transcriptional activator/DNA-binding beta-propeller fold protein YncE
VAVRADPPDAVEIRLLGSFEVVRNGSRIALGTRKQRAVLALLALEPRSPVSASRLIDALWGDDPPASARAVLQTYVAGLRKGLEGTGVELQTQGSGYSLEVELAAVDSERFRSLAAEARSQATRGEREVAAETLRAALALWRGRPLEEFGSEPGLVEAAERLEAQRVDATEERVEADLSVGASVALVDELQTLVSEHPYRERLRGQLMRALYLMGRQGEALEAYRDARRTLADDLGVEPGPELRRLERAILEQDPALAPAPVSAPAVDQPRPDEPSLRPRSRRSLVLVIGGVIALLAAATASVLARDGKPPLIAPPNSVAAIDPATNRVVATVPVGIRPGPVFGSDKTLWVGNLKDQSLTAIDVGARTFVGTYPLERRTPDSGAVVGDTVWVVHGRLGTISILDAQFGVIQRTIPVAGRETYTPTGAIAIADSVAWAAFGDSTFARLQTATGKETGRTFAGVGPTGVAVGFASVWVVSSDATLKRFNPASFEEGPLETHPVARRPSGIATGEGAVWFTSMADASVTRFDPNAESIETIQVGAGPTAIAVGLGAVWVANADDGTISRIDPRTNDVTRIEIGNRPSGLAVAGGLVWVAVQGP